MMGGVVKKLAAQPDRQLGHLVDLTREQRLSGSVTKFSYQTFPLALRRPERGTSDHEVACELCGQEVRVRLYSVPDTVRLRRRWLTMCVISLVVLGVLLVDFFSPSPAILDTAWLALLSALVAATALGTAVAGFTAYFVEDGVRMRKPSVRPGHNLIQPQKRPRG